MKKIYLFAAAALTMASCTNDEYLGDATAEAQLNNDGAILFSPSNAKQTRATVGKAAADLLGGNFIVEGFKGSEGTNTASSNVVFDNYLVVWGQNTAGTSEDNTNDWKYVGVDHSDKITNEILNGNDFNRTVKTQTIKYWDYSQDQYDFVAYSAGTLNMIATGDPENGTSVKVTKINDAWRTTDPDAPAVAYTFTAASAADFLKCYITDVTPVLKENYNKPVTLTFKNLAAKVRVGLYETIPGYSVKDVQFYQDGLNFKFTKENNPSKNSENKLTVEYYSADGSTTYSVGTTYDSGTEYYSKSTHDDAVSDATFFLTGTNVFPEAGSIRVSYPLLGTENASKKGYNKADVAVTPESGSTTTTKTFGALTSNYTGKEGAEESSNIYLGRTLATATMAGTAGDNYYTAVIPVSTGSALTLRCNYTLVSTDGSGETIKVWGAKAVVPANFCEWQPNYAYTYIFKISDNTNGSTEKLGGDKEGLFPITFDAVVADITDASPEQTTVTTVATPSVTTYQEGHKAGQEYAAGDIYVMSMIDGNPQTITGALIYTIPDDSKATEAEVIDALQMGETDGDGNVTGRNGLVLTKTDLLATDITAIPGVDGTDVTVTSGTAGKFTAVASKNYVFVYDYTTGAPTATVLYSYDNAASTAAPSDWSTNTDNPYYTKNNDGTYTQVTTAWAAGTYYKKYTNNNHTYAVKVIKTGTAY